MGVKGLARWTMGYFMAAYGSFLLAQLLLVSGQTFPAAPLASPWTLAAVHLITIGWLTLLMLGALGQFLPVITATSPRGHGLYLAGLILILLGLLGMETGFLSLGSGALWLPLGGLAVFAGITLDLATLVPPLWHTRPLPFAAKFLVGALAGLFLTLGLGIALALGLVWPSLYTALGLGRLFTAGLLAHLTGGLGAWFTLTAVGVSYKLLAMFSLAPEERGTLGKAVLYLTTGGLALVLLGALVSLLAGLEAYHLVWLGWAVAALGGVLYLLDMYFLFRQRKRRVLELNSVFAIFALAMMATSGAALLLGRMFFPPLAAAALYLFLFGWLSGLGLSQLYKIVPFLTWVERYGKRLGKGPVPRVQDLVQEKRARPWFLGYFLAVFLAFCFLAAEIPLGYQVSQGAALLTSVLIGREIWRSRKEESVVAQERRFAHHG
ncbi:MAG: hypothetical protein QJR00_07960 [Bacillota bacterium]|nr:hypothetical protein [Bacillota bacterium]